MIDLYSDSDATVSLQSFVDGRVPVLLWFWAPHCPVCRGHASDIEKFAQDNSHRIRVVGVGGFDDLDYAKRFVADTGTTFTMLWSDSTAAWEHYGMSALSSFWLLDRNGNRVDSGLSYDQEYVEALLAALV